MAAKKPTKTGVKRDLTKKASRVSWRNGIIVVGLAAVAGFVIAAANAATLNLNGLNLGGLTSSLNKLNLSNQSGGTAICKRCALATYEENASGIAHQNGGRVADSKASGGYAWQNDPHYNGNRPDKNHAGPWGGNFVQFGPYVGTPSGTYKNLQACWNVKDITPGNQQNSTYFDITSGKGKTKWMDNYASNYLLPYAHKNGYQEFCLTFSGSADTAKDLEFRVYSLDFTQIRLDKVTLYGLN